MLELTEDTILNGKISILQPKTGYRVAIDPIILANFIDIKPEESILDVGCGVGTISLILKKKNITSEINAIDVDSDICEICKQNSLKNNLNINVINSNIEDAHLQSPLKGKLFDHVVTNPPFFNPKSSRMGYNKRLANFETIELNDWISHCLKFLKNKGSFSIIHSGHRLEEVLYALKNKAAAIEIIPIFPKENSDAIRVILKCIKGSKKFTKISPPIILHESDGRYTKVAGKILNGG